MAMTAITDTKTRLTRWSPPSLDDRLNALLANYDGLQNATVIGPKTATALQAFVDAPLDAPMVSKSDVDTMLGLLAGAGKRKRSVSLKETEGRLDLYWQGLSDLRLDDLRHAYETLLKTNPWFPDISEIRDAAAHGPTAAHERRRQIARALILKHEREWTPPVEPLTPEAAAQVRAIIENPLPDNAKATA